MEEHKIMVLFATDDQGQTTGVIHMHDILQAGIA
jgi:hypothetical protein